METDIKEIHPIRPCPFCGRKAKLVKRKPHTTVPKWGATEIVCTNPHCGAVLHRSYEVSEDEVISEWNVRPKVIYGHPFIGLAHGLPALEMKPCPLCGTGNYMYANIDLELSDQITTDITCDGCGIKLKMELNYPEDLCNLVRKWNTRNGKE